MKILNSNQKTTLKIAVCKKIKVSYSSIQFISYKIIDESSDSYFANVTLSIKPSKIVKIKIKNIKFSKSVSKKNSSQNQYKNRKSYKVNKNSTNHQSTNFSQVKTINSNVEATCVGGRIIVKPKYSTNYKTNHIWNHDLRPKYHKR